MKKAAPTPGVKSKRPPPAPLLTPQLLAQFTARAEHLLANPDEMLRDTRLNLLIQREIMRHLVANPPLGVNSASVLLRASQEYLKASTELLDSLRPDDDEDDTHAQTRREARPSKPYLAGRAPSGVPITGARKRAARPTS